MHSLGTINWICMYYILNIFIDIYFLGGQNISEYLIISLKNTYCRVPCWGDQMGHCTVVYMVVCQTFRSVMQNKNMRTPKQKLALLSCHDDHSNSKTKSNDCGRVGGRVGRGGGGLQMVEPQETLGLKRFLYAKFNKLIWFRHLLHLKFL